MVILKRQSQKETSEYWNQTADVTAGPQFLRVQAFYTVASSSAVSQESRALGATGGLQSQMQLTLVTGQPGSGQLCQDIVEITLNVLFNDKFVMSRAC